MKVLFFLCVLSILVAAITAAVGRGYYADPKHPGKCVIDDLILSPGDEAQQNSTCGRMICGSESLIEFHTCGAVSAPPGYKLGDPVMPKAPYPDCCKKEHVKV